MSAITAKVKCSSREPLPDGQATVRFTANYTDDAGNRVNEEWAKYTPGFSCSMTVLDSVPFEAGKSYTLTFTEES